MSYEGYFPHWLGYFTAFGPVVIGVATFFLSWAAKNIASRQAEVAIKQRDIAARQAANAAEKLRLDLFERRMEVIDATSTMMSEALSRREPSRETEMRFLRELQKAKWLFDDEFSIYLEKVIWDKVNRLRAAKALVPSRESSSFIESAMKETSAHGELWNELEGLRRNADRFMSIRLTHG